MRGGKANVAGQRQFRATGTSNAIERRDDDLRQRLACKIEIKVTAKDKGQIVIAFDTNDDFERIIQALQK